MTVIQALTRSARRMGLVRPGATISAEVEEVTRDYYNAALEKLSIAAKWTCLNKSSTFYITMSVTVSGNSGDFTAGELVTGGTSGSTCVVDSWDSTNLIIKARVRTGAWTTGEALTGGSSGVTAVHVSETGTTEYDLASDVIVPRNFTDVTNNNPLDFVTDADLDAQDPDHDITGDPDDIFILSMNVETGRWIVQFFPPPAYDTISSVIQIRYRYRAMFPEFTSSDDDVEVTYYLPRYAQMAPVHGAVWLYMEQKGGAGAAQIERDHFEAIVADWKRTDIDMDDENRMVNVGENYDYGEVSAADVVVIARAPTS